MATKDKKTAAKATQTKTKVTRITASDDKAPKEVKKTTKKPVKTSATPDEEKKTRRSPLKAAATPFTSIGGYFKGAWYELQQVRWPTRRATWGLTAALLAYTLFFVVLILLLDALFKYVFQIILG